MFISSFAIRVVLLEKEIWYSPVNINTDRPYYLKLLVTLYYLWRDKELELIQS